MKRLDALFQTSLAEGALSTKQKELIALGIAVATHCEPCILVHMEKAIASGASKAEILEAWQVVPLSSGIVSLRGRLRSLALGDRE